MEKKKFDEEVGKIVSGPVRGMIEQRCEELFNSGGIDTSSYENDTWRLPLIVVSAALFDVAEQISGMLNVAGRKAAKNLRHF